jgi:hypothetical protein
VGVCRGEAGVWRIELTASLGRSGDGAGLGGQVWYFEILEVRVW